MEKELRDEEIIILLEEEILEEGQQNGVWLKGCESGC